MQSNHPNIDENEFGPLLNGGSNELQRNQRCQQRHTHINENAFEPRLNGGSNETKRETVRENYDDTPAANRACKDYKAK